MPGENRNADEIPRLPIVADAVDDAVAMAFEYIDDGLDGVAMAHGLPLVFRFARRKAVDPEANDPGVETDARIDQQHPVVAHELAVDLLFGDVNRRFLAPLELLFGELHHLHVHLEILIVARRLHAISLMISQPLRVPSAA